MKHVCTFGVQSLLFLDNIWNSWPYLLNVIKGEKKAVSPVVNCGEVPRYILLQLTVSGRQEHVTISFGNGTFPL